jgi:hypothetical protein
MARRRAILGTAATLGLALALAVPTAAPGAAVSGKVKRANGYTVLVVARDGKAHSRRLGASGAFKLRLKKRAARGATLALVAPDGSYAGPIVLRREPRRAYLALSGRVLRLGSISRRRGYAVVRRSLGRRAVVTSRPARAARSGRPRGAGRLGLGGAGARATAADQEGGAGQEGEDADRDGLVGAFDVDDDGDGTLDVSDPGGEAGGGVSGEVISSLPVDLEHSLNVNAAGVTREQVDALVHERLNLLLNFSTDQVRGRVSEVGVDCLGVVWCTTAEVANFQENRPEGLWRDSDANRDGLLDLPLATDAPVFQIGLWPRATTAQIAPGDTLEFVATTEGGRIGAPSTLASYFSTVPAIRTWEAGAGPREVVYPVPPGTPGTGSETAQLNSERLTLTFWRPQRASIPGAEAGAFTDMGNLYYGVDIYFDGQIGCAAKDYSNLSPSLAVAPPSFDRDELMVLRDSAGDAAPDPANTLSFTVDLGACARRAGVDPSGRSTVLTLRAGADGRNAAGQHMTIRFP